MSKKEKDLLEEDYQTLLQDIEKDFGEGAITLLGKSDGQKKEVLSTGSFFLDSIVLPGKKKAGYVRGKIIEIFGLQSSGKSTLALHAVRECQKIGEKAVYFDLENGLDIDYAKNIGVETEKLIVPYPSSGEEAFDMIIKLIKKEVGLIIVDSVSNLIPRAQLEASLEKQRVGSHASLMSAGLRKLKNELVNKKTIVIFINQIRKNISTGYFMGSPEITTGGMALNFDADLRIKLKAKERIDKADKIIGVKVEAKIIKNKFAPPDRVTELEIIYSYGIKKPREILKLAVEQEIVQKSGNWYSYQNQKLGNGWEATVDYLEKNSTIYQEIEQKILDKMVGQRE